MVENLVGTSNQNWFYKAVKCAVKFIYTFTIFENLSLKTDNVLSICYFFILRPFFSLSLTVWPFQNTCYTENCTWIVILYWKYQMCDYNNCEKGAMYSDLLLMECLI